MGKTKSENQKSSACAKCGMPVVVGEYHPYAACLMFRGSGNVEEVTENLKALRRESVLLGKELQRAEYLNPPKLRKSDTSNFDTLMRACRAGDLCLMSAIRMSTSEPVALCCAVNQDGEKMLLTPLAVMVEGNPYKEFIPATGEPPSVKKKSINQVEDGTSKE